MSSDSLCMEDIESHTNNGIIFLKFSIDCRLLHASSAKYHPKQKPLGNSSIGKNVYCSTMRCLFPAKCKFCILSSSVLEAKHLNMCVFMYMALLNLFTQHPNFAGCSHQTIFAPSLKFSVSFSFDYVICCFEVIRNTYEHPMFIVQCYQQKACIKNYCLFTISLSTEGEITLSHQSVHSSMCALTLLWRQLCIISYCMQTLWFAPLPARSLRNFVNTFWKQ